MSYTEEVVIVQIGTILLPGKKLKYSSAHPIILVSSIIALNYCLCNRHSTENAIHFVETIFQKTPYQPTLPHDKKTCDLNTFDACNAEIKKKGLQNQLTPLQWRNNKLP